MASLLENLRKQAAQLFDHEKFQEIIDLLSDQVLEKHKDVELYAWRARAHYSLAEYDKAIADYTTAINLQPDDDSAFYNRGLASYNKGDYDKAIADYTTAINLKPDYAYAYIGRGNAWANKGEYDKAIADYSTAINLKPDAADAYNNRGNAWANKSEYDKAIADYTTAINLKPDYAYAYIGRGNAWANKGEYDKAIADYTTAIELKPDFASAYYNRGNAWDNKGEYDKAITDYTTVINLKPDFASAYFNRGIVWDEKGEYDKAIADYNQAINLKPDDADAYHNLGLLYFTKGDYGKAKEAFEKKVELSALKPDYYTELAKEKLEEIERLLANKEFKEISELIDKIKKLLWFHDGLITHYTSLTTAKALIFNNSLFRLSEGAFLNDTSEGRELLEFLEITYSTLKNKGTAVAEVFAKKPFIGSFVTDSKFDDLTLWRMYGKEDKEEARGCAITMDMKKLVDNINSKLMPGKSPGITKNEEDINFYRVAYHDKENKGAFVIPGAKKQIANELNKLMKQLAAKAKPYWEKTKNKKDLEELFNSITYLFKSAIYMHENELRLVVKGIGFDKNISTPPLVYIELVGIKNVIQKITLGPKVNKPDEWAAAFYYSYDKEPTKPEIMISHLPFK